jgi:hypothetical protein
MERSAVVQGVTVELCSTEMHTFLKRRQQAIPCRCSRFIGRGASVRDELSYWCAAPRDDDGLTLDGLA